MKLCNVLAAASLLAVFASGSSGCTRNKQDAVLLANEAEKIRKSNKDEAIQKLEEASRLDPDNHAIWFKLASVHEEKEDWPKMAEALQGAINADEKNKEDGVWANYFAKRGYAIEMQARKKAKPYDEAKEPYTKCIEADENYADCYHQLGNVYLWTDDEQKALEFYTKAIQHNPDELRYYAPLADLYVDLNYSKEAEAVLKEAKTRGGPNDVEKYDVHVLMAKVLQERGDVKGAVTELEAAKAVPVPEGSNRALLILYNLGIAYADLDPPRKQDATDLLKSFDQRVCKGQKAKDYPMECESVRTTLAKKLNATVQ